jgi:hypothetical protein
VVQNHLSSAGDRRDSQSSQGSADSGSTAYYSASAGEETAGSTTSAASDQPDQPDQPDGPDLATGRFSALVWPDPDGAWFKAVKATLDTGPGLAGQTSGYFNSDRAWTVGLAVPAVSAPLMTMYEQVYRMAKKTPGTAHGSFTKMAAAATGVVGIAVTSSGNYIDLRGIKTTGAVLTAVSKVLTHYAERKPAGTYPRAGSGDLEMQALPREPSTASVHERPRTSHGTPDASVRNRRR